MKNLLKIIILSFLYTGIVCTQTACEKPDPDAIIYYKAIGKGYVFDATNNRPLAGITIQINARYGKGMAFIPGYNPTDIETVITDENGYYQVRFREKTRPSSESIYSEVNDFIIFIKDKASFTHNWDIVYPNGDNCISVWPLFELSERDFLTLDTIKFYKRNH